MQLPSMCMSIVITHHQFQCVTPTTPSINTKTTHRTPQHHRHAHTGDSSWPTCLFTLKPPNPFTARHHCFTHKRPRPRVRCCLLACCSQVKTDSKIGCKVLVHRMSMQYPKQCLQATHAMAIRVIQQCDEAAVRKVLHSRQAEQQ
jgi:hypothetical protein